MLGAVSTAASFFAFRNRHRDIDIRARGVKLQEETKNSPLEQYRYGGIDRRTIWIAAHDLLHRDDGAPSVIGRDGIDDPSLDPRVGLPSGLFGRFRFRHGGFIFRG